MMLLASIIIIIKDLVQSKGWRYQVRGIDQGSETRNMKLVHPLPLK